MKGDAESVAARPGASIDYRPSQAVWGHPGRSADVFRDGVPVGWIGQLHPRLQRALDLGHPVVAFEIDLVPLRERAVPRARPLSKFPSVRRDLAFVVPEQVRSEEHTSELQSLMRKSYAVFCLKNKKYT